MTDTPPSLTAAELDALRKLTEQNASHAATHFTDLAATWGLGGLHHQLTELLGGLRVKDRPASAVGLSDALQAYLDEFGPSGVVGTADTYRDHA